MRPDETNRRADVTSGRRAAGTAVLGAYRLAGRVYAKVFSLGIGGAFAEFGKNSVLQPPVRITGEDRIAIAPEVFIGSDSWLQALGPRTGDASGAVALRIGRGTKIVGHCVISASASVVLGERVLVARNAYIADHAHAFSDPDSAVLEQGVAKVAPVEIGDGAWLGENVVVGPGVRIGRGAVIGANSVVLDDVPDRCVAVGAPARVVRHIDA
jgi:acetyltransferase-like isoleucine patch superfamily enzyme